MGVSREGKGLERQVLTDCILGEPPSRIPDDDRSQLTQLGEQRDVFVAGCGHHKKVTIVHEIGSLG
jgi:hypothetical protein